MIRSLGTTTDRTDVLAISLGSQHSFLLIQGGNLNSPLVVPYSVLLKAIASSINIPAGSAAWGSIATGTGVGSQADLVAYLVANYVPITRTLTINGVTYDLSADRSWTISGGIYTSDNGITLGVPTANNFRLGGDIITPTTITAGFTTSSNSIRFDAPNYLPTGAGIYNFTGFNLLTTYDPSGNSILGSFDAHGAISLKVSATENAFGPPTVPGTGLFIESKDSLSIPFKIKGTVGDTLLFNNSGQLRLHEYDTSTAFSGVSGSSVGLLNVDNQGKVFVTPAPSGTGTVTNVGTGTGLTGGPITTTGTVSLNSKLAPADSLTGNALKVLRVNAGETAVEYATVSTGDSVSPFLLMGG